MTDLSDRCHVYKEEQKGVCPFCSSDEIEGAEVVIENGAAYQICNCLNCDKEWEDRYVLTTYLVLT